MNKVRGFTLIELMVVVAVIAILAGVALASYSNQIRKSKRTEAKQILADLGLRQEKYRATHATYSTTLGTSATGLNFTPHSDTNYTITIGTPAGTCATVPGTPATSTANSFQITATATGDQVNDSDCTTLVYQSKCGVITKTPASGCW